MASSAWWLTLALVPLVAAAGLAFHDPFHTEDTGPNLSVSHGLVFFDDEFIQFNLSVHNHQDNAENVVLTLELPDLGPIPDPEGDGGWAIVEDAGGDCSFPSEFEFRCEWAEHASHVDRALVLVGDAACLCGTFEMLYEVTADGEVDPQDNSQVITLDWPCDTPAALLGTSVDATVVDGVANIAIEVRNEDWWPPLFGVEIWSDLPIVEGGWTITDHTVEETGFNSCFVHLDEDLFCDVSPIFGMGSMRVVLEATPGEACGDHPFQVVVTSDSAPPRHLDRVLQFAPCGDHGATDVSWASIPFGREDGIVGVDLHVVNDGDVPANNVRIRGQYADLARPWSFDFTPGDDRFCVVEERDLVECVIPALAPGHSWHVSGWTLGEGWCGGELAAAMNVSWDNPAGPPHSLASAVPFADCEGGEAPDAAITASPHNGRDWVIITFNVTAVGDAASEDVRFTTLLPHLGGVRWLVHGEDREYCTLTFNDMQCDFGTIPAGVTRQVWAKAWQHHDGCGFDVVIAHLTAKDDAEPGGNNQAEATIVPPWKLKDERHGDRRGMD